MSLVIKIVRAENGELVTVYPYGNKTVSLNPAGLPDDIAAGDELYHIEHGFYDLYDKDGNFKAGLLNFNSLRLIESAKLPPLP